MITSSRVLADRRQRRRDVAQDLVGLPVDVAVDQLAGGRVLGHLPGQEKQFAAAHGHRERQARCWQLVTGNGVTCHGRGVPFPYVLSRWIFRQGYRDASTGPSAAGVTGILDPRRDPGCCAATWVDRLR